MGLGGSQPAGAGSRMGLHGAPARPSMSAPRGLFMQGLLLLAAAATPWAWRWPSLCRSQAPTSPASLLYEDIAASHSPPQAALPGMGQEEGASDPGSGAGGLDDSTT